MTFANCCYFLIPIAYDTIR